MFKIFQIQKRKPFAISGFGFEGRGESVLSCSIVWRILDIAFDLSPKYFSSSLDDLDDCKPSCSATAKTENCAGGGSENESIGELVSIFIKNF